MIGFSVIESERVFLVTFKTLDHIGDQPHAARRFGMYGESYMVLWMGYQ